MNEAPRITLELTLQQLEYVGNTLAQRPYAEVAPLLAEIQQQLAAQQQQEPTLQPPPRTNGAATLREVPQ